MDGKSKLLIVVVAFVLLIILGILSVRKPGISYEMTTDQALENALSYIDEVFPEDLAYIVEDSTPGYQLVDIRTPYDFLKGHISTATNIPSSIMLEEENLEYLRELDKDSVIIVLYGNDQSQANCPWMLLRQIGLENVKVLLGGYEYFHASITDPYGIEDLPSYFVEDTKYDFNELIQNNEASEFLPNVSAPEVIIPKRKKKKVAAEGGC
mgnify:CR=1 FL=1